MEDVAALQRTVRRCTAVVVVAVGLLVGAVSPGNVPVAALLVVGSLLYLAVSAVYVSPDAAEPDATAADGE
ncbi:MULTISPECIES: hypothetical protein [Halomicrobium]|uniref:Uncharacterized protein n=2 Tax=Halomicrobium mukohataei TaxID=57705 RepID=C7P2N9_HALMD|nr:MULTISPECIES: hypothetical protein [Halomicrobium]ACV47361.1 conserved hypothetical protein [Halomicrobium mukohataei DSM 12286]QCD65828.1 hypothetical protein E5139_09370 [Halomicrobium mukohataei]QFR20633.1 hypothetical protein GBQ70_09365 [Halomicrobium sp. ZPS1]